MTAAAGVVFEGQVRPRKRRASTPPAATRPADRAPAGMDIAAGEDAFDLFTAQRMLDAGAVDVLQPDATRRGGVTGFLKAATLAESKAIAVSAHCAPSLPPTWAAPWPERRAPELG